MIEISIKRIKSDVSEAIVQFTARRGYRLTNPWYLEGVRIEAPSIATDGGEKRGFWAMVTDTQMVPQIDVELKGRRRTTRVKMSVSNQQDSIRLAYELQAYLNDERSYETECPPMCPTCGNNVPNPISRFCGRCGNRLVPGGGDAGRVLRPPPVVREDVPPELPVSRSLEESSATESASRTTKKDSIIVERAEAPVEASGEWNEESPIPLSTADADESTGDADAEEDGRTILESQQTDRTADAAAASDSDEASRGERHDVAEAESEEDATVADDSASVAKTKDDDSDDPPQRERTRRLLTEE